MKNILFHLLLIFALAACSAGTGTGPMGGIPGGAGLGQGGPLGGPANPAAPEQDSGVVYPEADPDQVVIQMQCSQAKCTYNQAIVGLEGEAGGSSAQANNVCIEFKAYLGRYLNGFTPCCNERVVRIVDPVLGRYIDYESANLDGIDGGFEPKLPEEHAVKMTVHLAPEGYVSSTLGQWQDCSEDCVPESWRKFDNAWNHPSCAFMQADFSGEGMEFEAIQYQKGPQVLQQGYDSED